MKKIIRIFGLKIAEIETLTEAEVITHEKPKNPKGAILDISPAELEKRKEREMANNYPDNPHLL